MDTGLMKFTKPRRIKAACGLADPNAVWGMTQAAPELVHWLLELGVQFNMSG